MNDPNVSVEFCYTCLKIGVVGDKFVSLNFAPPDDITYKDKLKSCVPEMGLENTEDCFLCKPCSAALETAYTFRCMCLRTETRLDEFRTSQNKKSSSVNKSMKQELIDLANVEEETSVESIETYSTGHMNCGVEKYPINDSDGLTSPIEPQHLATTTTTTTATTTSILPKIDMSSDLSMDKCIEPDSEIEIVKKELGSLLTESLEKPVNINVQIFDKTGHSRMGYSDSVVDALEAAVEDLENNCHHEVDLCEEKKFHLQKIVEANSLKERKPNVENSDSLSIPDVKKRPLSDSEIIDICCKTISDLQNCTPESLDCRVTVEKITVTAIKRKKAKMFGSKKNYRAKAFWCTICHRDIHRRDRFNAHILKHSNIRAYKCSNCRAGFFSNPALNKHIKVCLAANQKIRKTRDNTNDDEDGARNSSMTDNRARNYKSVSPTSTTDFSRISEMSITSTNNTKDHNISFATSIKERNPINLEENSVKTQKTTSTNYETKTKKSARISKDADASNCKSRKSTRKCVASKRLCNMNDIIYRCKECSYQSYYKQKYQVHLLHHANCKPFECSECPKRFYERWELNRHSRTCHASIFNKNSSSTSETVTRSGRKVTNRSQLTAEANDTSSWETDSSIAFDEPSISLVDNPAAVVTPIIKSIHSLAETSPIEMSFACKLCKISFKSRNLLMLHTQTHELKRTCEVCQEQFISEADFMRHVSTHDASTATEEPVRLERAPKLKKKKQKRKFFCHVCNREFASRDHGNIHTGAKPYSCKVCGKHFAAYTTLRKHKLIHLSDGQGTNSQKKGRQKISPQRRTFSCEICKKKFVNKEYVYSHNCQSASGDTVYRCQICKNAFIGRAALIEHMGVHVSQNENATE